MLVSGSIYRKFAKDPCLGDAGDEQNPCTIVVVNDPNLIVYTVFLVSPASLQPDVLNHSPDDETYETLQPSTSAKKKSTEKNKKSLTPQTSVFLFGYYPRLTPHVCI